MRSQNSAIYRFMSEESVAGRAFEAVVIGHYSMLLPVPDDYLSEAECLLEPRRTHASIHSLLAQHLRGSQLVLQKLRLCEHLPNEHVH
jgi:hypothetical protein